MKLNNYEHISEFSLDWSLSFVKYILFYQPKVIDILKDVGKDGWITLICVPQKLCTVMWGVSACPQRVKVAGYYDYSYQL